MGALTGGGMPGGGGIGAQLPTQSMGAPQMNFTQMLTQHALGGGQKGGFLGNMIKQQMFGGGGQNLPAPTQTNFAPTPQVNVVAPSPQPTSLPQMQAAPIYSPSLQDTSKPFVPGMQQSSPSPQTQNIPPNFPTQPSLKPQPPANLDPFRNETSEGPRGMFASAPGENLSTNLNNLERKDFGWAQQNASTQKQLQDYGINSPQSPNLDLTPTGNHNYVDDLKNQRQIINNEFKPENVQRAMQPWEQMEKVPPKMSPSGVPIQSGIGTGPQPTASRIEVPAVPGINPKAMNQAVTAQQWGLEKGTIKNPDVLTVVDFSKPSTEKRLWVVNPNSGEVLLNTYVAHGSGSGGNTPSKFSNMPDSHQSSLGLFSTGETYSGKHGNSMRLQGLQPGVNDNAFARSVVVHPAKYVASSLDPHGYAGRSWGCFATSGRDAKKFINLTKGGSAIFAYYPSGTRVGFGD